MIAQAWISVVASYGMSPREIDEMTLPEFGLLASGAGQVNRAKVRDLAMAARAAQADKKGFAKFLKDLSGE